LRAAGALVHMRARMTRGLNDLEIDAANASNQRLLQRLGEHAPSNPREQWLRDSVVDLSAIVRSFSPSDYALPAHVERIMPADEYATLCRILDEVRALNDECAGLRIGEAELLLGTDSRPRSIRRDLMAFYDRLIPRRLERPNSRDRGDQVRRFERLVGELLPYIDDILGRQPSIHPKCLNVPQDYAAWRLYRETWRPLVTCTPRAGGYDVACRVAPEHRPYCLHLLSLYRWHQENDLANVLLRVRDRAPPLAADGAGEARLRLRAMAEDLEVMRPLLVRNYRASRSMVTLGPGVCVAWQWNLGELVGGVLVAPDERSLLTAEHTMRHHEILSVDREGLLASQDLPWIRSIDLDPPEAALAANLFIVERLYERVFEMYERVDTAAILARFRAPVGDEEADGESERADEAIAVAAQRGDLEAASIEAPAAEVTISPRRRVHGMRFERFIRVLGAMGCEVRQGKGSEVNIYREGGRIARIGHHLRNPELSPALVRIALDRLDIPVAEFLAMIS